MMNCDNKSNLSDISQYNCCLFTFGMKSRVYVYEIKYIEKQPVVFDYGVIDHIYLDDNKRVHLFTTRTEPIPYVEKNEDGQPVQSKIKPLKFRVNRSGETINHATDDGDVELTLGTIVLSHNNNFSNEQVLTSDQYFQLTQGKSRLNIQNFSLSDVKLINSVVAKLDGDKEVMCDWDLLSNSSIRLM